MNKVWVVFFETFEVSSGGFNWFFNEEDARDEFESDKKKLIEHLDTQLSLVEVSVDPKWTNDEITRHIEDNQDELMISKGANMYPLKRKAWIQWLRHRY